MVMKSFRASPPSRVQAAGLWALQAGGRPGGAAGRGADHGPVLSSRPLPMPHIQAAMENHLQQRLHQPQELLEDLRETEAQRFRAAMKYLLEDKEGCLVRRPRCPGSGAGEGAVSRARPYALR